MKKNIKRGAEGAAVQFGGLIPLYIDPNAYQAVPLTTQSVEPVRFDFAQYIKTYFIGDDDPQKYMVRLMSFGRKKYDENLPRSNIKLTDLIVDKIEDTNQAVVTLLTAINHAKTENGGKPIPMRAKAFYFCVARKSSVVSGVTAYFVDLLADQYEAYANGHTPSVVNPWRKFASVVHSEARRAYYVIDIDAEDPIVTEPAAILYHKTLERLNESGIQPTLILSTRTGFHILVEMRYFYALGKHIHPWHKEQNEKNSGAKIELKATRQYLIPYTTTGGVQIKLLFAR